MTPRIRPALLLLLAGAACATAGGGKGKPPAVVHQADEKIPPLAAFQPGDQRIAYNAALGEEQRGWRSESAGDEAAAKEPLEAAARAYLGFLQRFPDTGWDVTFRYHAADLFRRAGRTDDAVAAAQQVAADPRADPKSKAMAQLQVANAMTAAGKLRPLQVEARPPGSAQGAQREPVPEPWQRFVQAADAYLASVPANRPEPQDRTLSSAQLALVAARVAYATGDMEGARRRLAVILDRWPNEAQVFQGAAPLYVQSFVAMGDDDGARQARAQVRETASAQAQRAQGQEARQAYEKVAADLERVAAGVRYERAKSLLEQGKAQEAAQAFEAVAQEGGDVAASLAAAAIAWDRAGNGFKFSLMNFTTDWIWRNGTFNKRDSSAYCRRLNRSIPSSTILRASSGTQLFSDRTSSWTNKASWVEHEPTPIGSTRWIIRWTASTRATGM